MNFKINEWVMFVPEGAVYYGRVKKMTVTEEGVKVWVVFGPGENWREFDENQLTTAKGIYLP